MTPESVQQVELFHRFIPSIRIQSGDSSRELNHRGIKAKTSVAESVTTVTQTQSFHLLPPVGFSNSPELLQVLKVLEISLLHSADGVPVQIQELQVGERAESVPRNRPARRTTVPSLEGEDHSRGDRNRTRSSDAPEPVVVEGETLQVVEAQKGGGGDGGQSHSSQHQAVEAGQRQEVLLLQTQNGVLPYHQDLQGRQGLEPATVDGHQPVGVQVEPAGRSRGQRFDSNRAKPELVIMNIINDLQCMMGKI